MLLMRRVVSKCRKTINHQKYHKPLLTETVGGILFRVVVISALAPSLLLVAIGGKLSLLMVWYP